VIWSINITRFFYDRIIRNLDFKRFKQGESDTNGTMWIIACAILFIRLQLAYLSALIMNYGATGF